jgi:hypothetical protein
MEEQKWRIYAPEGRNTEYDCKMNLRTMSNNAHLLGTGEIFVIPVSRQDYGDDLYRMIVENEEVKVVAREEGQHRIEKGVFDSLDSGIFFNVSDKNVKEAESKLVQAFF